jgi:predicted GNAT family acetyltransferase
VDEGDVAADTLRWMAPSESPDAEPEINVVDNPAASRFEVSLDGRLGGFAAYRREGDVVVFTHTEIDDEFEGHGLGGRLVQRALDTVRASGGRVRPQCPFVKSYIERHPEYADLVADT